MHLPLNSAIGVRMAFGRAPVVSGKPRNHRRRWPQRAREHRQEPEIATCKNLGRAFDAVSDMRGRRWVRAGPH